MTQYKTRCMAIQPNNKPGAQDAGTFPEATLPIGKIHPFSKIDVPFAKYDNNWCNLFFIFLRFHHNQATFK